MSLISDIVTKLRMFLVTNQFAKSNTINVFAEVLWMKEKKSISVGLSLPKNYLEKIDLERGDVPRSRFITRIIQSNYLTKRSNESLTERKTMSESRKL